MPLGYFDITVESSIKSYEFSLVNKSNYISYVTPNKMSKNIKIVSTSRQDLTDSTVLEKSYKNIILGHLIPTICDS